MRINDEYLNSISHDDYLFTIATYADSSWLGHAPFLKYLMREIRPKVFVELGVHNGFSYFVACQSVVENQLDTSCFAIDHWLGDSHVGHFDEDIYENVQSMNSKYSDFSTLVRKDFNNAAMDFSENSIDLLHIDGHHSYESICNDFLTWLPKMKTSGIVLIHDVFVHRTTFGVFTFWKEIKNKYKTMEFTFSHGLGIIFLGDFPTSTLKGVYEYSIVADGMSQIAGTFGSIADDVIQGMGTRRSHKSVAERDSAMAERDSAMAERDSAMAERDSAMAERDSAMAERDSAMAERDSAMAERDSAMAERDSAMTERDFIIDSAIWKISLPYRKAKNLFFKI
jgi:hypothetical protein